MLDILLPCDTPGTSRLPPLLLHTLPGQYQVINICIKKFCTSVVPLIIHPPSILISGFLFDIKMQIYFFNYLHIYNI